jgi:hypothetical protein
MNMFRIITATATLAILGVSAPAFAKAHLQPADRAQEFGQKVAHNSYVVSEDAKGETDGVKGVDGMMISKDSKTFDRGADSVETRPTPKG